MSQGRARRLVYSTDERGNRIPDFSYCGYLAGERPIPDVPIRLVVPTVPGDATQRIQSALDHVAALPADPNGVRGAVLLEAGVYHVSGSLKITASGVVLRGGLDSWASGVLFDVVNIDGHALSLCNRAQEAQGAGWNAANSVLWNCSAARIDCHAPPTACNWAFGSWAEFAGNGYWEESNSHVQPRSLYYAQLQDRLGERIRSRLHLLPVSTEASSSPSLQQAAALTAQSRNPPLSLSEWIDQAPQRQPIPTSHAGVKTIDQIGFKEPSVPKRMDPLMHVENGWLVYGDVVMTGKRQGVQWWNGGVRPLDVAKATPHVTRFVPGRSGAGLTDDLEEMTEGMRDRGQVALEHNYGLWYERRRDDHERVRRMDGDVWPPFYELPFARSGQGTAFDGLSRYDLTKYNSWYWMRLRQFADLADRKGLVLLHQNYFQHNIIEAGSHWTDFPWRPANNINDTGFPEPPPYARDKRIFLAEQFYDVNHPLRRPGSGPWATAEENSSSLAARRVP